MDEIIKDAVASGDIKNVGETYTDNWEPALAQTEMEQFLTANNNKVDAVLSENDGMAGGVVAALDGPGPRGQGAGVGPGRRSRPPSTASRSARRRSTSGRTPACSARPPARPPSQLCANRRRVDKVTGAAAVHDPGRQQRQRRSC